MKYTFLLPAFKARYFEEALLSIKHQTYTDFVCIVSDDCSPDNLKSIFDKTVGDDPRFSYRRNEVNMGSNSLVAHWNLLVDMCETPYFMLACDDDLYKDTFLEEVDKLFLKYPEVGAVRARVQHIHINGSLVKDIHFPEYVDLSQFLHDEWTHKHLGGILNFAFNREIFKQEGGFPEIPLAWFSDIQSSLICSKYGICNTKEIQCSLRLSDLNLSLKKTPDIAERKIQATFLFRQWITNFISDNCKAETKEGICRLKEINKGVESKILRQLIIYGKILPFIKRWEIYMSAKDQKLFSSKKAEFKYIIFCLLRISNILNK